MSRLSKKIISSYNLANGKDSMAVPKFPLWAFSKDFPENVSNATIGEPQFDGADFYFPIQLFADNSLFEYKITFATKSGEQKKMPDLCSFAKIQHDFPLKMSCYKIGLAIIENNCYKLYDEKWCKIRP